MKPLNLLRNHPVVLLVAAVTGLAAWVVADAMPEPHTAPKDLPILESVAIAEPPPAINAEPVKPAVVTANIIPQLRPGMTRSEVEGLTGPPRADLVEPVTQVDGRMTYRATYLTSPDPATPNTIRPFGGSRPAPPVPKSLISLEFDASRPGHPLIKIHVLTPTS